MGSVIPDADTRISEQTVSGNPFIVYSTARSFLNYRQPFSAVQRGCQVLDHGSFSLFLVLALCNKVSFSAVLSLAFIGSCNAVGV